VPSGICREGCGRCSCCSRSRARSDLIGPRLRALGALVGAMLWFQMFIALLMQASEVGSASLGVAVYPCLVMGELISCYRAAGDVRGYS
jgi:hypothetical protein